MTSDRDRYLGRRSLNAHNSCMHATLDDVEFVPFSIEAGGVWGPAARKFFRECLALADDDRDVDLYHWSSTRFSRAWFDSLSVLAVSYTHLTLPTTPYV